MDNYREKQREFKKNLDTILRYDYYFNGINPSKEALENHREMIKKSLKTINIKYSKYPTSLQNKTNFNLLKEKYKIKDHEIGNVNLETKINLLEFSTRTRNCIYAGLLDIFRINKYKESVTVRDLLMFSEKDIKSIRNAGKAVLSEIKEKLSSRGYSLRKQ